MFIEPVFGNNFFGREEVLGTLNKRVTALKGGYRQNLALAGPMLTGKSSILRHFLLNINDPEIIPLYIELGDDQFNTFCERFMATLLFRYLRTLGCKGHDDFNSLLADCSGKIPQTVLTMKKVKKLISSRKNDKAYDLLLTVTSVFKDETGKKCIVILDEFHNLANFRLKKPFQVFGKYIMIQKNTMYVVSSSQKTILRDILSKKLALLFGNFEILEINGFDNQTARSFVNEKLKNIDQADTIKDYMIQLTGGNPFYLSIFAETFSNMISNIDLRFTSKECLLETFALLMYESNGLLNQYFMNTINFFLEKKSRKKYIPTLLSLSKGNKTIKSLKKYMGRSDKSLSENLEQLRYMDLVYCSGNFWTISDKLFECWISNVYGIKATSVIDDMDIKYIEFKNAIEDSYNKYCQFHKQPDIEKIADLFRSFNNDKVHISLNNRKLPKFDVVKWETISTNSYKLTAKVKNHKWVCIVKTDDIAEENDINNVLRIKSKTKSSKVTRKIFISLKGIEQNAFILAKEHNIWIWDVAMVNDLMRLYRNYEMVL